MSGYLRLSPSIHRIRIIILNLWSLQGPCLLGQICTTVGGLQISQVHYLALKLANIAQALGWKGQELTGTCLELEIELIDLRGMTWFLWAPEVKCQFSIFYVYMLSDLSAPLRMFDADLSDFWLVVWYIFYFPILGMSSSQLMNSYFSEGVKPPIRMAVPIFALGLYPACLHATLWCQHHAATWLWKPGPVPWVSPWTNGDFP